MRNVKVQRTLAAPPSSVWAVLADYPNIADWNAGVLNSYSVGDATEGGVDSAPLTMSYGYEPKGGPLAFIIGPILDRMMHQGFNGFIDNALTSSKLELLS